MVRVFAAIAAAGGAVDVEAVARRFQRAPRAAVAERVAQLLEMRLVVQDGAGVRGV